MPADDVEVTSSGLTQLSEGSGAAGASSKFCVNIIFVHGLGGSPRGSWEGSDPAPSTTAPSARDAFNQVFPRARDKTAIEPQSSDSTTIFWPQDFLAGDLPEARIWTYGYKADVIDGLFQTGKKNSISQHGRDLSVQIERTVLVANRDPILFVAHNVGGIIVKDAINRSQACQERCNGVIFLGTPHRGSDAASLDIIAANLAMMLQRTPNHMEALLALKVENELLESIHINFTEVLSQSNGRMKVHSFQEGRATTGIKGLGGKVVGDYSSKIGLPETLETVESLDVDHRQMTRCFKRSSPQYRAILGVLRRFVFEATEHGGQDDGRTVYSDTQSLRDLDLDRYVTAFARELSDKYPGGLGRDGIDSVVSSLPTTLTGFAYKMGNESTSKENAKIKYFVHRYRHRITEQFRLKLFEEHNIDIAEELSASRATSVDGMSINEIVSRRTVHLEGPSQQEHGFVPDDVSESDAIDDDPDPDLPELSTLRDVLKDSSAFAWLLSSVTTESRLETPGPEKTRESILEQLLRDIKGSTRFSRHYQDQVTVEFELVWDFPSFYKTQQYECTMKYALHNAITVTGTGNQVQAATVHQYMCQVWPETGPQLLDFLGELFEGETGNGKSCQGTLPGGLSVLAQSLGPTLSFQASGDPFSVAELGAQLSWLGAALRASSSETELSTCIPFLHISDQIPRAGEPKHSFICRVEYHQTLQSQDESTKKSQETGSCWRALLRNPTIVEGYPIPRRSRRNSGMEVSLDIMAALINGRRMVEFCGTTFIKGFSAMLAAVTEEAEALYWHLYYNEDGSYISYEDPRVPRASASAIDILKRGNLSSQQHIVGWCASMKNYTGAPDANYLSIGRSELEGPSPRYAFEKVTISAGKFITVGSTFAFGLKDPPLYFGSGDDYVGMLLNISDRHFVFYDCDDRRAWLVDGASGLLHLLRASIKHLQKDKRLRHLLCYDEDDFQEASETNSSSDAAFEVLSNKNNQALPLYPKKPESWQQRTSKLGAKAEEQHTQKTPMYCLADLIEHLCHILGQITAHQDDIRTEAGVGFKVKISPREQLEGFDFKNIALRQEPLLPKAATLSQKGFGWVDFTRAIRAITLFGTGFGQLFAPKTTEKACGTCLWNSELPKGEDYLAATVPDIKKIIEERGSMRNNPWRLADKIYWISPDKLFAPCKCPERSSMFDRRGNRVQVLLSPTTLRMPWAKEYCSPAHLAEEGAVIFGRSSTLPLFWRSQGDPDKGELEHEELEKLSGDSARIEVDNPPSAPGSSTNAFPTSDSTSQSSFSYSHRNSPFVNRNRSTAGTSQAALDLEQDATRPELQAQNYRDPSDQYHRTRRELQRRGGGDTLEPGPGNEPPRSDKGKGKDPWLYR
ncbi:hypothetical protein QBC39DRAFT_357763 [Podospora conica]|nr:hypothetical protein QBC39DRAFT_357763 [Schizothecium conicum]